jgi:hypothetical protein
LAAFLLARLLLIKKGVVGRQRGEAMNMHLITVERREHARYGVMEQLEDITYSVLRKYGVVSDGGPQGGDSRADHEMNYVREEDTTVANLMIIARNDQPKREQQHPHTWLLYKASVTLEVYVEHDRQNKPHILDRGAA